MLRLRKWLNTGRLVVMCRIELPNAKVSDTTEADSSNWLSTKSSLSNRRMTNDREKLTIK
jgi:hypothetical protein